jgi:hypothetical protein
MAVRSLARSGVAGGKYISFLAGNEPFSPDSDFLITETVLGSNAASVVFDVTGLSATYKHLQLRIVGRSSRASNTDGIVLRFNSDSATNYSDHELRGDGTSVTSSASTSSTSIISATLPAASVTASAFGASVVDILDIGGTKNKTTRSLEGFHASANSRIALKSGLWRNTGALTGLTLTTGAAANFVAGSRFSLYGSNG